jgi:hypothetical protein
MANPIKLKCTVSSIINQDDTVFTIILKPSRRLPNFQSRQFLHLAFDTYDPTGGFWPPVCVFSMASLPLDPEITFDELVAEMVRENLKSAECDELIKPHSHQTMDYHQ